MTCHEARELYSALLDEALDAGERAAVEAHVAGCPECARELERFRRAVSLVRAAAPVRAPIGFVDRVLAAARPLPWYRRLRQRLFRPLAVKLPLEAAALLLVGGAAVYLFQHTPELQQTARQEAPRPELPAPPTPGSVPAPASAPNAKSQPQVTGATPFRLQREGGERVGVPDKVEREAGERRLPEGEVQQREPSEQKSGDQGTPEPGSRGRSALEQSVPARKAQAQSSGEADSERRAKSVPEGAPAGRAAEPAAPQGSGAHREQMAREPSRDRVQPSVLSDAAPPSQPSSEMREEKPAAPGGRHDAARQPANRQSAGETAHVTVRLAVADLAVALRALPDLLDRAGGREMSRRADGDAASVDMLVPRESYADFLRALAQLGRLSLEHEPDALPGLVRVALRIGG